MNRWDRILTLWEASCWLGIGRLLLIYIRAKRAVIAVLIHFLRWLNREGER